MKTWTRDSLYQNGCWLFSRKYPKCPEIYLPNLSVQVQKFGTSIKKRLHWASVVRDFFPFYVSLGHFTHFFHFFRGDHVIPSISEAFPNPDIVKEVGLFQTFISQFSYLNLKSNKSKKRNLGMYANTSHNMHDFTLGTIQVLRQLFSGFFRPTYLRQHK